MVRLVLDNEGQHGPPSCQPAADRAIDAFLVIALRAAMAIPDQRPASRSGRLVNRQPECAAAAAFSGHARLAPRMPNLFPQSSQAPRAVRAPPGNRAALIVSFPSRHGRGGKKGRGATTSPDTAGPDFDTASFKGADKTPCGMLVHGIGGVRKAGPRRGADTTCAGRISKAPAAGKKMPTGGCKAATRNHRRSRFEAASRDKTAPYGTLQKRRPRAGICPAMRILVAQPVTGGAP